MLSPEIFISTRKKNSKGEDMEYYDPFKDYLGLSNLFNAPKIEMPRTENEIPDVSSTTTNYCRFDSIDFSDDKILTAMETTTNNNSQRFENEFSLEANIIESSKEIATSPNFRELMGQVGHNGSFDFHNHNDTVMELVNLELGRPDVEYAETNSQSQSTLYGHGTFSASMESGVQASSTECNMFPSMSDISTASCDQFQPFMRHLNPPVLSLRTSSFPNAQTNHMPYSSISSSYANIQGTFRGNGVDTDDLIDSNYSSISDVSDFLFRLKDFLDAQPQSARKFHSSLEGKFCALCKRNGETKEFYTTHVLKDNRGKVICPILRKYVCPQCNATGDNAHTLRHCPVTAGVSSGSTTETFRTRRSSCGWRRKHPF